MAISLVTDIVTNNVNGTLEDTIVRRAIWDMSPSRRVGPVESDMADFRVSMLWRGKPVWGHNVNGGSTWVDTPELKAIPHGFTETGYVPKVTATVSNPGDVVAIQSVDDVYFYVKIVEASSKDTGKQQDLHWIAIMV
jgi:hypothetical protein